MLSKHRFWLLRWGPAIAWMILIFVLSSLPFKEPTPALELFFRFGDKAQHMIGYAVLSVLLWRALDPEILRSRRLWISILISTLYGASDEFHQSFVPNREASVIDLAADAIGSSVAAIILYFWSGGNQNARRTERETRKRI